MNNPISDLLKALAYSSEKHQNQRRKGYDEIPYINHPIKVANMLSEVGKEFDGELLSAAILHDVIEDTDATYEEIENIFGEKVANIVTELTDDMSLSYEERKRIQIEHAPHLSPEAKKIKLADKTCNIIDILDFSPDWSEERKILYIDSAKKVVDGLRGVNKNLEDRFDNIIERTNKEIFNK